MQAQSTTKVAHTAIRIPTNYEQWTTGIFLYFQIWWDTQIKIHGGHDTQFGGLTIYAPCSIIHLTFQILCQFKCSTDPFINLWNSSCTFEAQFTSHNLIHAKYDPPPLDFQLTVNNAHSLWTGGQTIYLLGMQNVVGRNLRLLKISTPSYNNSFMNEDWI